MSINLEQNLAIGELLQEDPTSEVRERFLVVNPGARFYHEFPDFSWWRLQTIAVRYVGGFGRMSWVNAESFHSAEPDPIAPHAKAICTHMNLDHAEAQVRLIRHYAGQPLVRTATMTSVDRLGCDFDATSDSTSQPVRIRFPEPESTTDQVRQTLVAMLRDLDRESPTDA